MANLPEPSSLPFDVRAIASFTARSANEMSIEAGKVYKVIQTDGKGQWWNTQGPNGNYGWFPANYVEVLPYSASSPPASNTSPAYTQTATSASMSSTSAMTNSILPAPLRVVKDKEVSPITVNIHVVGARNLKTDTALQCQIYLFHVLHDKDKDGRLVHKSTKLKKAKAPEWNEKFEVSVKDPETESIRIKVIGAKKKIGEVVIVLRATVRPNITSPNSEYKYHKLVNGEGELQLWVQYSDSRQASGPSNFQHKSHIGFNSASGTIDFGELASLPEEFRKLAETVNQQGTEVLTKSQTTPMPPSNIPPQSITHQTTPPPPPQQVNRGPPPPQQPANRGSVPSPQPSGSGAPPPPPPPSGGRGPPGPPPPPSAGNRGVSNAGGLSLAEQLANRGGALNKVETREPAPLGDASDGGPSPTGARSGGGGMNFMSELQSKVKRV
jgi:hypothetical protein